MTSTKDVALMHCAFSTLKGMLAGGSLHFNMFSDILLALANLGK